jgi:hypothetical protein
VPLGVQLFSPLFYFSDGGFLPKAATTKISFNTRPHPGLLPPGEGVAVGSFLISGKLSGQVPVTRNSKNAANDSPSPWGEGRGEGGRHHKSCHARDGGHPACRRALASSPAEQTVLHPNAIEHFCDAEKFVRFFRAARRAPSTSGETPDAISLYVRARWHVPQFRLSCRRKLLENDLLRSVPFPVKNF